MKRFILGTLCLMMVVLSISFVSAKSDKHVTIKGVDGRKVKITIEADEMPNNEMLQDIVDENLDSDTFIIYEVGHIETKDWLPNEIFVTQGITSFMPLVTSYTSKNVFESDRFIESCAKGETITISRTITEKLSLDFSGDMHIGTGGLKNEISYSLTKGKTLVGPPESSRYNSRQFRCKFYQNKGNWSQIVFLNGIKYTFKGNFKEPAYYVSYSKDTYQ